MSTITAIQAQKKRGNRRSIFVDGRFVAGAHEQVVEALDLRVGQAFEPDRLVQILHAETARKAYDAALRLISYRDRSISELRSRLVGNDFPEDIVEKVVEQLREAGLLDDEKFSRDWVRSRSTSRPMGRTRLAWELRSKGVAAAVVDEAVSAIDEDTEYQLARSLIESKLQRAGRADSSLRGRLGSFLRRRGFGWDVITKVTEELCPDKDTA